MRAKEKMLCTLTGCGILLSALPSFAADEPAATNATDWGKAEIHPRLGFIDRHYKINPDQEDLAVGGWVRYETPDCFRLSGALSLAGAQSVGFDEGDRNGAGMVPVGRDNFAVLNEAYLQISHAETWIRGPRQILNTPYLNEYDIRIIPISYEAITAQSVLWSDLTWLGSYVYGAKPVSESVFYNMTEAGGFEGGSRPLWLTGVQFERESVPTIQVWEYYFPDYFNIIYSQLDYAYPLCEKTSASLSLQGTAQQDAGDSLDGPANTGAWGIQTDLLHKGWDLGAGFTQTADNRDMINPWSGYPGYTSLMEEDCNLAGEKAWLLILSYDFSECGIQGLSSFVNVTGAWTPDEGSCKHPAQDEANLTVDYKLPGILDGLWIRLRAASVNESLSMDGDDYTDYRVYLNYSCLL